VIHNSAVSGLVDGDSEIQSMRAVACTAPGNTPRGVRGQVILILSFNAFLRAASLFLVMPLPRIGPCAPCAGGPRCVSRL